MSVFLAEDRPFPYCPGCGHPHVLRALDGALARSGIEPSRIVLVTDIGCVGLADALFPTLHTVHTLHGRAAAVAVGLRLGGGDGLRPVVLVGDGGASIGLLHLVHAAQLDANVTVLVHNNLVYGMTGGQHSTLTPEGLRTTTTPDGCTLPALDLGDVLGGAGATFFARARAPGAELEEVLAAALAHPGFACVEALELCPSFAAKVGGVTGKALDGMAAGRTGILRRAPRPPLPTRVEAGAAGDADGDGDALPVDPSLARLAAPRRVVVAGRAGERVQSAARFVARCALAAGLEAAVRTDNPVTQGKGFSLAELTVSPAPIRYTGMERPDAVVLVAEEGRAVAQGRGLLDLADTVPILIDEGLAPIEGACVRRLPLRKGYGPKAAALGALLALAAEEGWWEEGAFEAALAGASAAFAADARATRERVREGLARA